jgi:hypothetical protein
MLDSLAPAAGDVVTVTRIDRLTRSTFDLFAIVTLEMPRRNSARGRSPEPTPAPSKGRLIAVLGGLAHVERDLIRTRTAEGRSAQKRGQHSGRPSKPTRKPKHDDAPKGATLLPNSPAATTWARARFRGSWPEDQAPNPNISTTSALWRAAQLGGDYWYGATVRRLFG